MSSPRLLTLLLSLLALLLCLPSLLAQPSSPVVLRQYGAPTVGALIADVDTGILYIAAQGTLQQILRFTSTGAPLTPFSTPSLSPCGVSLTPPSPSTPRLLYVSDCSSPFITVFHLDGTVASTFTLLANASSSPSPLPSLISYTLSVDSTFDVYRIATTQPRTILRFDATTHALTQTIQPPTMRVATGLGVQSNGDVVIADDSGDQLLLIPSSPASPLITNATAIPLPQVNELDVDPLTGDIFASRGPILLHLTRTGLLLPNLTNPYGTSQDAVAVDSAHDVVYSMDDATQTVHQFSISNGTLLGNWLGAPVFDQPFVVAPTTGPRGEAAFIVVSRRTVTWYFSSNATSYASYSQVNSIGGITTDSVGRVWITSYVPGSGVGVVLVLGWTTPSDPSTGPTVLATVNTTTPALLVPSSLYVDASFSVYVCDSGNARIVRLSLDSQVLQQFTSINGGVPLSGLRGVYVSPSTGAVYAISSGTLLRFDADGQQMTNLSSTATLPSPVFLVGDVNGLLYVADSIRNAVVVMREDGSVYATFNATAGYPWKNVGTLALDAANSLWVLDYVNKQLYVTTPTPAPAPAPTPSDDDGSSSSSHAGVIAGVVIAVLVVLAVVLGVWLWRRRSRSGGEDVGRANAGNAYAVPIIGGRGRSTDAPPAIRSPALY